MKHITQLFGLIATFLLFTACTQFNQTNPTSTGDTATTPPAEITVYAYDSLTADYGLLPNVIAEYETAHDIEVDLVSFPDTGSMINQLIQEQEAPRADVVMGIDNIDFANIADMELFQPYQPVGFENIDETLLFDDQFSLTPFDYGYVGFVYDTESNLTFPEEGISLQDLATAQYKDQIIIQQPGASSPGTQLLAWSHLALGDEAEQFWANMNETVLTVTPDWSTAYYSLFLEGEAPIVLSYLTSPAYHIDQESTNRYQAIPITEGYLRQVEGVGIVAGTDQLELGQAFIDFTISPQVQAAIPTTQWVFPVLTNTALPDAYSELITPTAANTITASAEDVAEFDDWLTSWNEIFNLE